MAPQFDIEGMGRFLVDADIYITKTAIEGEEGEEENIISFPNSYLVVLGSYIQRAVEESINPLVTITKNSEKNIYLKGEAVSEVSMPLGSIIGI